MNDFNIKTLVNQIHEIEIRCSEIETVIAAFQTLYNEHSEAIKDLQVQLERLKNELK